MVSPFHLSYLIIEKAGLVIHIESEIDGLVFQLYGLNEEVKIVEDCE